MADFLNTSVGNLTRMRYLGVGPAYVKLGRAVRYRWEDVEAYVEANIREALVEANVREALGRRLPPRSPIAPGGFERDRRR